jgi:hypothetical protein
MSLLGLRKIQVYLTDQRCDGPQPKIRIFFFEF